MGKRRNYFVETSDGHDPEIREKLVADIRKLKEETPCVDCGHLFPYFVMDFDHVRGKKRFNISAALRWVWPKKVQIVWDEITKCEVVCSNCHRIRTHARFAA